MMTSDVLAKIDLLIEMSKSTANYDTLKAELEEIEEEIEQKRKELEELTSTMQAEKYMKASDRIIDENIKVSLELKIQKMGKNRKKLEKQLHEVLEDEKKMHESVQSFQSKIAKLTKLLDTLNEKSASLSTQEVEAKDYYQKLIAENEKKLESAKSELQKSEEEYQQIANRLSVLTNEVEEMKNQIASEKEKLDSTIKNLQSNESYIDKTLKEEDEKRVENLEKKLDELKKRKEEIQNDAVMIGNEAKELIVEDDRTGSLLKVKELVNRIKELPYMDITSSSDVDGILKEALERASLERDEFASTIENKNYDSSDSEIIKDRQKYLEDQKKKCQDELMNLQNKIKEIDTVSVREINSLLSAATVIQETLKKELSEYKKVLEQDAEALPKKKATLMAAYNKKEEELTFVQEIINDYEMEMEDLILESKRIETEEMAKRKEKMITIETAQKEIAKKIMMGSKAKDVLALENDKAKLKELNETVKRIHERQKYTQTPSEIYDEIEMSLGSINESTTMLEGEKIIDSKPREESLTDWTNNFRISADIDEVPVSTRAEKNKDVLNEEETINMKTSFDETFNLPWENIEPEPIMESTSETPDSLPEPASLIDFEPVSIEELKKQPEPKNEPVTERYKVIDIEDLDTVEPEPAIPKETPSPSDEVIIGDFKDDDYIDFDSIIGG